jgi:hypothetical protein
MNIHDEAIRLLSDEVRSRVVAAEKNRARGMNINEERALQEAEHLRFAIRFFARLRKAQKKIDTDVEVSV